METDEAHLTLWEGGPSGGLETIEWSTARVKAKQIGTFLGAFECLIVRPWPAIGPGASREGDLPRQPALTGNGGEDDVARTGQQ